MKNIFFLFAILLSFTAQAQNRNATVKLLNNYIEYSNANTTGLKDVLHTLESYNDLFNGYLRRKEKLGGEEYEKPKASPFVDEAVFTMNQDNPDYLYSIALKESAALPAPLKTELNSAMKSMLGCSQRLVKIMDSMSLLFSNPPISVTNNPEALPYRLLYQAKKELQLSKNYRDQLFSKINDCYTKACPLTAAHNDYIYSVDQLNKGMNLCQNLINDVNKNDSSHIAQYVRQLDSLHSYLERSELILLKGIAPFGSSKQFPNKGYYDGFDLYINYENIVDWIGTFSTYGKNFINNKSDRSVYRTGKCYYFHNKWASSFNATQGLLYTYNQYVLLIGGGKMKLIAEVSRGYVIKGWGDETHSLPARTLLHWMKETPRFEVDFY
jgi:hypothetical protein